MKKFFHNVDKSILIRNSFLLPILLVVIMSISHVVSWYDMGNPFSWAIYLSVAIEIFALASVAATGINAKRTAVWFLFVLVTIIQIIGNIFFTYKEIKITDQSYVNWMELIGPIFPDWTAVMHRRFLAVIQGGTLPFMSLIALYFYIKFYDSEKKNDLEDDVDNIETKETIVEEKEKKDVLERNRRLHPARQ